jgi:hypothetical protein
MNSKTIYKIGAADDSDIVIKQATVSKNHCELRWTEQGWQLRDLDSTNGTFVDGKRLTESCYVTEKQRITLGRDVPLTLPPEPRTAPVMTAPVLTVPITPAAVAVSATKSVANLESSSSKLPFGWLLAGSAGVSALLLLAFIFVVSSEKKIDDGMKVADHGLVNSKDSSSVASKESEAKSGAGSDSADATSIAKQETQSMQVVDDSPFWAILIESADGTSQRLVGTAVAIESNRLVALASIAEAIEEVKDAFPKMFLAQMQQPTVRLLPSKILIHPNFKKALAQLSEFETQLNEKIQSVEAMSEPSVEESLEWSGKLEDIMFSLAKSDLACFTTDVKLKKFLPLASNSSTLSAESCEISGYPMIVPSPIITNNLQSYFLNGKASVQVGTKAKTPALFCESKDFTSIPLVSMICLNQQSQIVGLCVREEPVQGIGDSQRCHISSIEAFWK